MIIPTSSMAEKVERIVGANQTFSNRECEKKKCSSDKEFGTETAKNRVHAKTEPLCSRDRLEKELLQLWQF